MQGKATTNPEHELTAAGPASARTPSRADASEGGEQKLAADFVKAWAKVVMLDRFDVQ